MATTFCMINQKGGCGKSSTCFHLAGAFADIGFNVLLLDMDPQGSLSQGFLGTEVVESLESEQTLAMLFDEKNFFASRDNLLIPTPFEGITLCPANQLLAPFVKGRDPIKEADIRPIAKTLDWKHQRKMWRVITDCQPVNRSKL